MSCALPWNILRSTLVYPNPSTKPQAAACFWPLFTCFMKNQLAHPNVWLLDICFWGITFANVCNFAWLIVHTWLLASQYLSLCISLWVYAWMCVWFAQPVCDICMHMCMHLGLLYELVLSVCECGRGRPSACQYVLMLHIWFPNFPPSPPCPPLSSPPPRCQDTVLFFQGGERGVMEGMSDEWWPWIQDINILSLSFCLYLSSSSSFCSSIALCLSSYFLQWIAFKHCGGGQGYMYEEKELSWSLCPHSPAFLCWGLSSRASTSAEQK